MGKSKLAGLIFIDFKERLEKWRSEHSDEEEMDDETISQLYEESAQKVTGLAKWFDFFGKDSDNEK